VKIFIAITVARQIEGDMSWVRVDKAHTQASEIDNYLKGYTTKHLESFNTPEFGAVECECVRGAMEVELEGI